MGVEEVCREPPSYLPLGEHSRIITTYMDPETPIRRSCRTRVLVCVCIIRSPWCIHAMGVPWGYHGGAMGLPISKRVWVCTRRVYFISIPLGGNMNFAEESPWKFITSSLNRCIVLYVRFWLCLFRSRIVCFELGLARYEFGFVFVAIADAVGK